MKTNEQMYESIKSDLLDLMLGVMQNLKDSEFIQVFEDLFKTHFNVTEIEFFLYEENQFYPAVTLLKEDSRSCVGVLETLTSPMLTGTFSETDDSLNFADDTLMIRNEKREPVAMVLVKSTDEWHEFASSEYFKKFQLLLGRLIETIKGYQSLYKHSQNHESLLEATKTFSSTMELGVIHSQLVSTVSKNLEPIQVELILSQEQEDSSYPYRLFDYSNELPSTVEAFLSGELTLGKDAATDAEILSAPVKGMQGTYGILQLSAPCHYKISPMQKEFVRNISESAGHAIENTSLYDQSHRLIRELQLVNEVSKKLTERLTSGEMITYINNRLKETFEPEEVAFVYVGDQASTVLSRESTSYFMTQAGKRYLDYAESRLRREKCAVFIADLRNEDIEGFTPYRSLMIAPIIISEKIAGYALLMHTEKYHFTFDDFKLVKAIISHSSLALSNSALREKLQDLANKDQMTGLYARGYLDRHMSSAFKKGIGGAFLLLDVDDFKQVNDQFGHTVGDCVLKQTAELLKSSITEKDIAGRWGGEEFAIYLPGATLREGKQLAKQLLLEMPRITQPSVTVSIGVSVWEPSTKEETYQQLFQNTDEALYSAKSGGKNRIIVSESVLAE
ncbi:sensor domain-containing diguanylate cyclase [Sporosarcina gallistercoris]|uniref:Sensor domain-containing diguanylate cyclase n=1 Tax=Sporosarcina gallistercoris TaxID=2762245 RepID=A0ABR8PIC6_9BACL|nr:sensor domain-containing diguanylate cyclase [Sporosarcina gallistercoris]MBD7907915.1 sensor domain-containing diguanylate cyclase [Sporosarcina gallistercoris]